MTKAAAGQLDRSGIDYTARGVIKTRAYKRELARLQVELAKLQMWIKHEALKIVVIVEGRDAAGKMVIMDRSWYNRAGVEKVMGFCSETEYEEFMRSCPEFERMLVRSGILLVKCWFSVSDKEQEKRFQGRLKDLTTRWKLSPMDLESRKQWLEYSIAKDVMFAHTDIEQAPWYVVNADNKKQVQLNCITHLLGLVDYRDLTPRHIELHERPQPAFGYVRPPMEDQEFVPEVW